MSLIIDRIRDAKWKKQKERNERLKDK